MMMVQMMMKLTLSKFPFSLRGGSLSLLVSTMSLSFPCPSLPLFEGGKDEDEEEDEEGGFPSLPQFHPRISLQHTPPSRHICHSCLCVFTACVSSMLMLLFWCEVLKLLTVTPTLNTHQESVITFTMS